MEKYLYVLKRAEVYLFVPEWAQMYESAQINWEIFRENVNFRGLLCFFMPCVPSKIC